MPKFSSLLKWPFSWARMLLLAAAELSTEPLIYAKAV